ncbi:hypothetical protein MHBO_000546 [Bonamia ostreae]|uniref:Ditrans,polycis-polyprenyl diphosphate synthase ((2E,6E)-farnesyldiphosphate specific) n=1 Tax=Bonamia ostreae TaxID=126728 RepID=A0ABV2AG32_9EUKA
MIAAAIAAILYQVIAILKIANRFCETITKIWRSIKINYLFPMNEAEFKNKVSAFKKSPTHIAISFQKKEDFVGDFDNLAKSILILQKTGLAHLTLFCNDNSEKINSNEIMKNFGRFLEIFLEDIKEESYENKTFCLKIGKRFLRLNEMEIFLLSKSESDNAVTLAIRNVCSEKEGLNLSDYDSLKHKSYFRKQILKLFPGLKELDILINVNMDRTLSNFPPWLLMNCQMTWATNIKYVDMHFVLEVLQKFSNTKSNFGE